MAFIDAEQIVWTTFYTIDRLSEEKNGSDALMLYFKYLKQSRIQKTNQSWSLDSFMMQWLPRGRDRFNNAKALLKKLWLIEVIQKRNVDWTIDTYYVKTNFIIDETKVKQFTIEYNVDWNATWIRNNLNTDFPETGETTTNALSTKDKCLKNINKIYNENSISLENDISKQLWNNTIKNIDAKFEEFRNIYPNKKGKANARILWAKIKWVDYDVIINACKLFAIENKWQDIKYIKHWNTWLSQQCWEDYQTIDRETLKREMYNTWHEDVEDNPDTAHWKNMKEKYTMFWDNWYNIRMEDKQAVKHQKKEERLLAYKTPQQW